MVKDYGTGTTGRMQKTHLFSANIKEDRVTMCIYFFFVGAGVVVSVLCIVLIF